MFFKQCAKLSVLFVMLLLSACASMEAPKASKHFEVKTPADRQAQLAKIVAWNINGAFSIQRNAEAPEIASYVWSQLNQKDYRIHIFSALGLYRLEISHQVNSVTLWKNTLEVSSAKTPEKLMVKAVGWSLPLSEMGSWIKGMAVSSEPYRAQYDAFGHITALEQAGWLIHYRAYQKQTVINVDLPQEVLMERPGFSVKIVIKEWVLPLQNQKISVV